MKIKLRNLIAILCVVGVSSAFAGYCWDNVYMPCVNRAHDKATACIDAAGSIQNNQQYMAAMQACADTEVSEDAGCVALYWECAGSG
jgi:hypothetical protein